MSVQVGPRLLRFHPVGAAGTGAIGRSVGLELNGALEGLQFDGADAKGLFKVGRGRHLYGLHFELDVFGLFLGLVSLDTFHNTGCPALGGPVTAANVAFPLG